MHSGRGTQPIALYVLNPGWRGKDPIATQLTVQMQENGYDLSQNCSCKTFHKEIYDAEFFFYPSVKHDTHTSPMQRSSYIKCGAHLESYENLS